MKPFFAPAAGPACAGTPPIIETARSPAPVTQTLATAGEAQACPALDELRERHVRR